MKTYDSEYRASFLRRTAREVRNYKITMRILSAALAMIVLLMGLLYIVAVLYKQTGSFTVSLDKYEMTQHGLTLSPYRDMRNKTSHLDAQIAEDITNIAEESLPDNLDMIDGEHNGDNYVAYTFYLQNGGDYPVDYEYSLDVSNITNMLDEAVRIRLYQNGSATTYAKTASDGSGAEWGTTEFYSAHIAARGIEKDFKPGQITRYTVVIWIEGNDPDCIDWLIGGELRVEMNMRIVP